MKQEHLVGDAVRQTSREPTAFAVQGRETASRSPAVSPVLLTDREGAALYNMGLRRFLAIQAEPWFPRPVWLGPRSKRHVRERLLAAVEQMPTPDSQPEPKQLLRARIERAKRTGELA